MKGVIKIKFKISIVIITYNRKKDLKKAISSIINQKFDNYEIIIIDNNSNDGTKKIVNNFKKKTDKRIKYFKLKKNFGVAEGRNVGFKKASGEYVFFLDDDAYIENKLFLDEIHNYFVTNKDTGAIGTKIYNYKTKKNQNPSFLSLKKNELLFFPGGSHAIKKNIFKNEKLYPSKLFYGREEFYASLKIIDKGYKIKFIPDLITIHNPSDNSRLNDFEIKKNNIVNDFVIKILLYPKYLYPFLYINFFLRLIKHFYISPKVIYKCYKLFLKRRIDENNKKINVKTIFELIKIKGFMIL